MPLRGGWWHVGIMEYAQRRQTALRDGAISHTARSGEESDQLLSARPIELNYLTDTLCRQHDSQKKKNKERIVKWNEMKQKSLPHVSTCPPNNQSTISFHRQRFFGGIRRFTAVEWRQGISTTKTSARCEGSKEEKKERLVNRSTDWNEKRNPRKISRQPPKGAKTLASANRNRWQREKKNAAYFCLSCH